MKDLAVNSSTLRAAGCFLGCLAASWASAHADSSGPVRLVRFSVVTGGVEWRPDTSTSWAAATANLPIRQGAQVWAPAGSRAELIFDDGTVVRLAPDEPMRMSKVTEDGDYVLFVAGDTHPIVTISLKTGDDIGFHREGDRVIAVYGIQEKSLPNGEYVWTRK